MIYEWSIRDAFRVALGARILGVLSLQRVKQSPEKVGLGALGRWLEKVGLGAGLWRLGPSLGVLEGQALLASQQ